MQKVRCLLRLNRVIQDLQYTDKGQRSLLGPSALPYCLSPLTTVRLASIHRVREEEARGRGRQIAITDSALFTYSGHN